MERTGRAGGGLPKEPPPEVRRIAEDEGFGAHLGGDDFGPGGEWTVAASCLALFCVLLGTGGLLAGGRGPGGWALGIVPWFVAAVLVGAGYRRDRRLFAGGRRRVDWYERGMVLFTGRGHEPHAWRDVVPFEYVTETDTSSTHGSRSTARYRQLLLSTTRGGLLLRVPHAKADAWADRIAAVELRRARECLERGETVTYGRFALSGSGLIVDGVEHPWREVGDISVTRDDVEVLLLSGWNLTGHGHATAPIRETPHLRTLEALVKQRAGGS